MRTSITHPLQKLDRSGMRIREQPTEQHRVPYSVVRIFAEVKVQKKRILARFFRMGAPDPKNLITNIPKTHRWQHDKEIAIDSLDLVDYAMTFVEASCRSHLTTTPA
jgi:predicted transport protein